MEAFENTEQEAKALQKRLVELAGIEIAKVKKLSRLTDDLKSISKKYDINKNEFMTNSRLNLLRSSVIDRKTNQR